MTTEKVKPKKLLKGDTLGIVAPASQLSEDDFQQALHNIEQLGFVPKYSRNIRLRNGFLAGEDRSRIEDLHSMFADPDVNGIICLRGGYGSARLLPDLDFEVIKNNPKVFVGYSDITALLAAFHSKTGLVGFHGPMGSSKLSEFNSQSMWGAFSGTELPVISGDEHSKTLVEPPSPSPLKGEVIGGNLSILCSLIGTPYDFDYSDKILVIEEVGETPYRIDRMLTQLINAGKLQQVRAVAFGLFSDCQQKDGQQTLMEVLTERMAKVNIPSIYGLSLGHVDDNATLPIGIEAQLDFEARQLQYLELPVI